MTICDKPPPVKGGGRLRPKASKQDDSIMGVSSKFHIKSSSTFFMDTALIDIPDQQQQYRLQAQRRAPILPK